MEEPFLRLRWKICKALRIPLDDPLFDRLSNVQLLSYAHLIQKDAMEEDEAWRDRLEYLARFWDNEAVDKVQRSREQMQSGAESDGFNEMLKHTFGRTISKDKK